ncbi:MAG: hypothetical protein M0T83_07310 [Nitrospiraceae bacterium]|nr:hypothetical protein [Nitrospiraceae bacterium]
MAQTKEPDQGSGAENLAPHPYFVMGMPVFRPEPPGSSTPWAPPPKNSLTGY